jgi:hypothetical protein
MTPRESETARKLTAYLDRGTSELREGTVYRLQQIRADALVRLAGAQREEASEVRLAHAFAGTGVGNPPRRSGRNVTRLWIGAALFVAVGWFGWQQWQALAEVREFEELDAQILSSDLPIDAYMDRGFQNWLKASLER